MKHLLILFITVLAIQTAYAQTPITYTNVIEVKGASKDVLYSRAMEWIASIFNNPDKVIKLKDSENGKIILNAIATYSPSKFGYGGTERAKGFVDYTINIFFKDGRFKYEIKDFIHKPTSGSKSFGTLTDSEIPPIKSYNGMKKRAVFLWEDLKQLANNTGLTLSTSLIDNLKKESQSESDDW